MAAIIHRIGTNVDLSKVYGAAATLEGLKGWWTSETVGRSEVGGTLEFYFRNDDGTVKGKMVMEVTQLTPNQNVSWKCKDGPPDWIGTEITFDLKKEGETTILLFAHKNWKEATESTAHCSMKWATFLLSLRSLVETGKGRPAPNDLKIDNWN